MIITICGSMRFAKEMMQVANILTIRGHVIMLPNVFDPSPYERTSADLDMLQMVHAEKILLSDAIYIVDVAGYIGETTIVEYKFARNRDKLVLYLSRNDLAVNP